MMRFANDTTMFFLNFTLMLVFCCDCLMGAEFKKITIDNSDSKIIKIAFERYPSSSLLKIKFRLKRQSHLYPDIDKIGIQVNKKSGALMLSADWTDPIVNSDHVLCGEFNVDESFLNDERYQIVLKLYCRAGYVINIDINSFWVKDTLNHM